MVYGSETPDIREIGCSMILFTSILLLGVTSSISVPSSNGNIRGWIQGYVGDVIGTPLKDANVSISSRGVIRYMIITPNLTTGPVGGKQIFSVQPYDRYDYPVLGVTYTWDIEHAPWES